MRKQNQVFEDAQELYRQQLRKEKLERDALKGSSVPTEWIKATLTCPITGEIMHDAVRLGCCQQILSEGAQGKHLAQKWSDMNGFFKMRERRDVNPMDPQGPLLVSRRSEWASILQPAANALAAAKPDIVWRRRGEDEAILRCRSNLDLLKEHGVKCMFCNAYGPRHSDARSDIIQQIAERVAEPAGGGHASKRLREG